MGALLKLNMVMRRALGRARRRIIKRNLLMLRIAVKLQGHVRRFRARQEVKRLRELAREDAAASVLGRRGREWLERRRRAREWEAEREARERGQAEMLLMRVIMRWKSRRDMKVLISSL